MTRVATTSRRCSDDVTTSRTCRDCPTDLSSRPHARYCDDHRALHRRKPVKYVFTPERDAVIREYWLRAERNRSTILAAKWGMPKWAVAHRAVALGLTRPLPNRTDWTPAEEATLLRYAGLRSPKWIARKLGRTEASVVTKAKRHALRLGRREGYTCRDLAEAFGVDAHKVMRWADEGKLAVARRGYAGRDPWAVTDAAVLAFVLAHPTAFELRRVNQPWFMDLIAEAVKPAMAERAA